MQGSFVLKHVTEPETIIMASKEATVLSFLTLSIHIPLFSVLLGFLGFRFGFSMLIGIILSILVFIVVHIYMIYRTTKDPYFINIWLAEKRCKKTKNFVKLKDNHYGD